MEKLIEQAEQVLAERESTPRFQWVDFGQAMQGKPNGLPAPAFDKAGPLVPRKIDNFFWAQWSMDMLRWWQGGAEPLFISGPTGAGKTASVNQLAHRFNYPVYEVTGHARLEFPELVGHYILRGQDTLWVDGPLTRAMKHGGIFLCNEIDLLDPSTATGLNTVLDGSPLTIPETGEVVKPHEGFRFIATANTVGGGDDSGLYQGTLRLNAAFMDRFTVLIATYMPRDQEERLVRAAYPNMAANVVSAMCQLAETVRALYIGDDVPDDRRPSGVTQMTLPLSTRSVLRWAKWTGLLAGQAKRGVNVLEASMMLAFGNRADAPMQVALKEILQRIVG